jgi:serine/threonine-protein kinase
MTTPQSRVEPEINSGSPPARPYGQYVLVRKLAEGGMAEIFLAKRLGADGFERNVVIKRMLPHLSGLPDFVEMFRDEARLAAKLSHPNIIQIHELGFAEGCYYICMEYMPGEDFSTTVRTASHRRQYVPVPLVMKVLAEAARGLHYAHDFTDEAGRPLNIVHRDISPSNLYVTYQGQVKVLDFGIAKAESRLVNTTAGVVKGKYVYMAPEQARGEVVDRRADVFSLGVSLYESLTHVRPFARENDLAVLNALLKGEFKPPRALRPDLSPDLEAVVLKAMAFDREERYPSAAAFADDLEELISREAMSPTPAALASFLRATFGEERFAQKTRIPTMTSLIQSGVAIPAVTDSMVSMVGAARPAEAAPTAQPAPATPAPPAPSPVERTSVVGPPPGTDAALQVRRRKGLWAVGAASVLLLAGGAFVVGRSVSGPPAPVEQPQPPPQPIVEAAPPAPTSPTAAVETPVAAAPVQPPPGTAQTPPAEPAVAHAVAPTPEPAPAEPAPVAEPVQPPVRTSSKGRVVTLEAADIQRTVNRGRASIKTCFEQYKADLPSDTGEVRVRFTIYGTGRVKAAAQGPLASAPVGRCLEKKVERLRFPQHRDKEVTAEMNFDYRVQR